MGSDQAPRGATPAGPSGPTGNRQIVDILERLHQFDPGQRSPIGFTADSQRVGQAFASRLPGVGAPQIGVIVHALPHLNWYKVQLNGTSGSLAACMLGQGSFLPLGVRDTAPIPPNSAVLVARVAELPFALILGVMPEWLTDGRLGSSDWIAQGGGSGMRREAADLQPLTAMARAGGVLDFSSGRPVDATPFDRGWMTETGIGLHIDPAMAFLRVDESCGIWMHLWDRHLRLAARSLQIESWAHEEHGQNDEGELRLFRGESVYPWEALGLYAPGAGLTDVAPDKDVFYGTPRGKIDLPDGQEDAVPFYRYREWGGYLGQGRQRFMALPPAATGVRRLSDTAADPGVFHEQIAIDGSYSLRSAKSVFIGKRFYVAVPVERHETPDAQGDDARAGGYLFSGVDGTGPVHKVGDVSCGDAVAQSLLRPAGVLDFLAHAHGWKGMHPFYYHTKDFQVPQPAATAGPVLAADTLDFGVLASSDLLPDPTPVQASVDGRYGPVNYYGRDSGINFLEDGGIVLEDGCGARIVLAGGKVRIETAADIELVAGRQVITLGKDLILRANGSVDISAAQDDVRIKAEQNVQVVAGNSGVGGLLLESKSVGVSHDYAGKFGTDVAGTGIVLKAASSEVDIVANDIYLRTGGEGGLGQGQITLDAGQGSGALNLYGQDVSVFTTNGFNVYVGSTGTTASTSVAHHLGPEAVVLGANTLVIGTATLIDGGSGSGIVVDGPIDASQSIACNGVVASQSGGSLVAVSAGFANQITQITAQLSSAVTTFTQAGTTTFQARIIDRYYSPPLAIGNAVTLPRIGFSFRDPTQPGAQYHTANLMFLEPRWNQLVRLGAASGGVAWTEPSVVNQGLGTYPWPGAAAWNGEDTFLRLANLTMYDASAGVDRDRPGPYEEATLAGWDAVPMSQGLQVIY